ncbi:MAG: hypothetical protein ACNYPI_01280 [Arenicellales bacterium WSBS_2016_MAG_OTU3]
MATYTLTIMPYDTTDDIEITIPAGAAMDGANNGNTASDTLTVACRRWTPSHRRLSCRPERHRRRQRYYDFCGGDVRRA